jgi:tetratricopeptide (TPR) repeat protein
VLFLLPPLLAVPLGVRIPWPLRLAHLALGMGVTLLLCWPWYGANWLFVLSNGWAYADTAHYYVTCAAGSLCWWTAYLRWLPLQMGPWLCPLPLLSLWGSPSRREALLWGLYGGGYLLYTLVAIKDVRFTLPLLPLLAILSAGGLAKLWRYLGERWGERALRRGVGMSLALGALALLNLGQPLAPGVAPLWKGIQMRWQGQHPQQELTRWIGSRVQPGLTATLGVLPNTELISSETLSYLAALQRWPITFRGAGQTPWPEVELALLDGFVDAPGEQGIVGPYGPAKEQIRQLLDKSPDWQQEHFDLPAVGRLSTYFPSKPRVVLQELPAAAEAVELLELQVLPEEGIPAWHLRWQGPAQDLAQTLVWARLEDPQGQVLAKRAWVVGQNRLLPYAAGSWQVEEILAWPELATKEGILHLEWQPPQGRRRSFSQPWEGSRSGKGGSLISPGDPLFLLQQAARAAAIGDLEALSLYLNAWTTLQYPTFLTDPDRVLIRQLLEGEEQWAAAQSWRERQIQSHYELALLEVALLRPQAAQRHFQRIVELDPEDNWARAYLAFLRVFFTHDFRSLQGLQQELAAAIYPLCQKANPDWDLSWLCAAL